MELDVLLIDNLLEKKCSFVNSDGVYCFDISNDKIKGLEDILYRYSDKYPYFALIEHLDEAVDSYPQQLARDLAAELMSVSDSDTTYEERELMIEKIVPIIQERIKVFYSIDTVLDRVENVDIGIDCGDSGWEFTANCIYPACDNYYSLDEVKYDSPIVWLLGQQGHRLSELAFALKNVVKNSENIQNEFVKSLAYEVWHEMCSENQLFFFVKMKLRDVLIINSLMKWSLDEKKWGGYIIVTPEATSGFYSHSVGSCSVLGIKPEKEIKIPCRLIHRVMPDYGFDSEGYYGYSLESVINSTEVWDKGRVVYMSLPKGFRLSMESMGLLPVKKNERHNDDLI
ncbi:MAG: hypothetical protein IJ298_10095 [Ruminococcus sp.]|nr:hypothetical protein [Ruminococcus sp.]